MSYRFLYLLSIVLFSCFLFCCNKTDKLSVGGLIIFSVDTLKFDTVFTTQGSFTNGFLIYNPQDKEIILSNVRLQNGNSSYFHLNVDGYTGNNINNLKIAAHDSLYVFATVNINPNNSLTPFYILDSLIATLNGHNFVLPITAYGQNAHFLVSDSISKNTTWLTDKPYVIIHSLVIGPNISLNIPANCKIYLHQDARIFVYGALNVDTNGNKNDSVVFQGDRLDRAYFGYLGYPGEWGGLYFITGSSGNINHAVIKNCGGSTNYYNFQTQSAAIEVDSGASLTINHTVLKNAIGYGILNFQGNTNATNCLINTTGAEALITLQGGNVNMTNCTFANYGSYGVAHTTNGTVTIINYLPIGNGQHIPGNLNATLTNCIVYGSLDSEIICDARSDGGALTYLNNCIIKSNTSLELFVKLTSCFQNQDPLFIDPNNGDFHLSSSSPAIGKGKTLNTISDDLEGNNRGNSGNSNDIGCYQHH